MPLNKSDSARNELEALTKKAKEAPGRGDEVELAERLALVDNLTLNPENIKTALKELYTMVYYLRAELRYHLIDHD